MYMLFYNYSLVEEIIIINVHFVLWKEYIGFLSVTIRYININAVDETIYYLAVLLNVRVKRLIKEVHDR